MPVSGCREQTSPSGRVRGFRGEALNQSRSDSGVYTGLTMRHQCGWYEKCAIPGEMPHRCVRRKCTSSRFSASSLTDSLRSVVRLRRAVSTHSKTKCCYPQNQGIRPERTCEQKGKGQQKAAPLAFFHRLRPPDEHHKNRRSSQRWRNPTGL